MSIGRHNFIDEQRNNDRQTAIISNSLALIFNCTLLVAPFNYHYWHVPIITWVVGTMAFASNIFTTLAALAGAFFVLAIVEIIRKNDSERVIKLSSTLVRSRKHLNNASWFLALLFPSLGFYFSGHPITAIYNIAIISTLGIIYRFFVFLVPLLPDTVWQENLAKKLERIIGTVIVLIAAIWTLGLLHHHGVNRL